MENTIIIVKLKEVESMMEGAEYPKPKKKKKQRVLKTRAPDLSPYHTGDPNLRKEGVPKRPENPRKPLEGGPVMSEDINNRRLLKEDGPWKDLPPPPRDNSAFHSTQTNKEEHIEEDYRERHIDESERQYDNTPELSENMKVLDEDGVRAFVYSCFESNPELRMDEIKQRFENEGYLDTNGSEISLNRIRGLKSRWGALRDEAEAEREVEREIQRQEEITSRETPQKERIIMRCPECRGTVPEESRFCSNCGFDFDPEEISPPQNPPQSQPPKVRMPRYQQQQQPAPQEEYEEEPQGEPQEQYEVSPPQVQYAPAPKKPELDILELRKKSKLEVFIMNYNDAVGSGNIQMQKLMGMGILAEMDKMENNSNSDLVNTLVGGLIKNNTKNEPPDAIGQLEKLSNIMTNLNPPQGNATSDNVEMAKAITGSINHGITEVKQGIMEATGSGNSADMFIPCPVCNKTIVKDVKVCGYCGAIFEKTAAEGVYVTQDQLAQAQQEQQQQQQQQPQPPAQPPYQPTSTPQESETPMKSSAHPDNQPQVQPPPQPQEVKQLDLTPKEIRKIEKYSKKLANMIISKKNPEKTVKSLWGWMDEDEKPQALLASIIGRESLYDVMDKLAPQIPSISQYLTILKSQEGMMFVEGALEAVKNRAREENLKVHEDRFREILKEWETKIGFEIEVKGG